MPEDEKEKVEIKEDEALVDATDAAAMSVPDEWWRHSAFVIKGEPETVWFGSARRNGRPLRYSEGFASCFAFRRRIEIAG